MDFCESKKVQSSVQRQNKGVTSCTEIDFFLTLPYLVDNLLGWPFNVPNCEFVLICLNIKS